MTPTDDDNPRVFVPPPLIFGGLIVVGLLIDGERGVPGTMQLSAVVLVLIGLALIALALGLFRISKTRAEPWQPTRALVARGIYRFTRNPMYLGMAIISLALALLFASVFAAILTLVATIIIDRAVIKREEAYLARRFGEDYAAYCRTVRRWL